MYLESVPKDTNEGGNNMDKLKLEYEMKKRGVSVDDLCNAVGISRSAYYRKVNGKSEFTQGEIQKIVDYLGLSSPMGIFFAEKVS